MPNWIAIAAELGFDLAEVVPSSGGCINDAATLRAPDEQRIFVKTNASEKLSMFESEAEALEQLTATKAIRVPSPTACGIVDGDAFLALEHIEFGRPGAGSWLQLGEQLAALHDNLSTDGSFGWHRDNVIGETPQPNPKNRVWATFFVEHRLRYQIGLASAKSHRFAGSDALLARAQDMLTAHEPTPSLLHGDLWSGNAAFDQNGAPVIFDPATYYGDPETDLAFTRLFGGFDPAFYEAYYSARAPEAGHRQRQDLYNLYHLLNHANLFGGSYVHSCQERIQQLL